MTTTQPDLPADPTERAAALRRRLTPEQYHVTQEAGTERPFTGQYWDTHDDGTYHCIVCDARLFDAGTKFDSGTGWPSFFEPMANDRVTTHSDSSIGMVRTEVLATQSGSHLGHVFEDGPAPTGKRYCINSAALRFVPVEDLEKEGYGKYRDLFAGEHPPADHR